MEGVITQVLEAIPSAPEEKNDDNSENEVCFGELKVFDSLVDGGNVSTDQDFIEQADQEWFTHHL